MSAAIAGTGGAVLFFALFVRWYDIAGLEPLPISPGQNVTGPDDSQSAFQAFSAVDLGLCIAAAIAALAVPVVCAGSDDRRVKLGSSVLAGMLGLLAVLMIVVNIASPPDLVISGAHVSDVTGAEVTVEEGAWIGLAAGMVLTLASGAEAIRRGVRNHRLPR